MSQVGYPMCSARDPEGGITSTATLTTKELPTTSTLVVNLPESLTTLEFEGAITSTVTPTTEALPATSALAISSPKSHTNSVTPTGSLCTTPFAKGGSTAAGQTEVNDAETVYGPSAGTAPAASSGEGEMTAGPIITEDPLGDGGWTSSVPEHTVRSQDLQGPGYIVLKVDFVSHGMKDHEWMKKQLLPTVQELLEEGFPAQTFILKWVGYEEPLDN
ncbi:hypothetical protein NDU88_005028 [Pleurodeles waltl]|uniref:Uncharacterized protein n=1 Tax=Pleurodeles waltl TaxID=8319 RepID=A0AAV7T9T3_PLEWA|nr:hypothetical protein NDU88_005028 [Pleurodeles waltl]